MECKHKWIENNNYGKNSYGTVNPKETRIICFICKCEEYIKKVELEKYCKTSDKE